MKPRTPYLVPPILLILLLFTPVRAELKLFAHPEVYQGRSFIIFAASSESYGEIRATFDGRRANFYEYGFGRRAIIGTEPELKPGEYPIVVEAKTVGGRAEKREFSIEVNSRLYPKTSFWLRPARKKLLASDIVSEEWAVIEKYILAETPKKFWKGAFKKPVPGIVTMAFGSREFINGKRRGCHRGVDFRAKVGTPVIAPEAGQLIFAKKLRAFGGTAVIDHGQGIYSLYFHLSRFLVPAGTFLRQGELFAKTGNSGISSGPHLHWGLSVHNVRSDPLQWVETVMP